MEGFADDIVIEATVLKKPVEGLDLASKVMGSVSDTYESLEFTKYFSEGRLCLCTMGSNCIWW